MKKTVKLILAGALALQLSVANAQLQLPQPSPKASVMQQVGLTDITIDYSSPAVKGRTIWGGLVPFGEVWRAGANAATKITFSKDVTIEGAAVSKGSYSIFMIPSSAADCWCAAGIDRSCRPLAWGEPHGIGISRTISLVCG